jgi:hypothetical protein
MQQAMSGSAVSIYAILAEREKLVICRLRMRAVEDRVRVGFQIVVEIILGVCVTLSSTILVRRAL